MKVERMVRKGLVILAAAVLSASSAYAANVETMGVGSMNTGQAGAVSAYCDNVFAAYYNPAGLSLIEKPTLSVETMFYDAKIKVYDWEVKTAPPAQDNPNVAKGPIDYESDEMLIASPHLGFAMPVSEKFVLGVAAYAPYGLHVTWDKDPTKSPSSAYAWESYYGRFAVSPTLSYKVSDKLSVGVGVSLGRSVSEAGKTNEFDDRLKDKTDPNNQMLVGGLLKAAGKDYSPASIDKYMTMAGMLDGSHIKMETADDFNYSFNVGVMYRPIEQLSFGLTYRGRTSADFDGDVKITNANIPVGPGVTVPMDLDGTVKMEYDHPEQVQAGVRWFANAKLSIEADVTWTGWSVNDMQNEYAVINLPDGSKEEIAFEHDRDWEDTTAYKIGVAYQATDAFTFRAGYTYDPSPVPDETFEFGWPDTDRNVYALGMGWKINDRWMLDAVLQHVISTEKRPTTGESSELNNNYALVYGGPAEVYCKDEGILWGAGVSVTYTF